MHSMKAPRPERGAFSYPLRSVGAIPVTFAAFGTAVMSCALVVYRSTLSISSAWSWLVAEVVSWKPEKLSPRKPCMAAFIWSIKSRNPSASDIFGSAVPCVLTARVTRCRRTATSPRRAPLFCCELHEPGRQRPYRAAAKRLDVVVPQVYKLNIWHALGKTCANGLKNLLSHFLMNLDSCMLKSATLSAMTSFIISCVRLPSPTN